MHIRLIEGAFAKIRDRNAVLLIYTPSQKYIIKKYVSYKIRFGTVIIDEKYYIDLESIEALVIKENEE